MPTVTLPAPVALARPVDTLTPPGVRQPVWEPKWDGYRVLVGRGRLYSRRGVNLTRYFPDLAPVLAARLPDDVVLDGELIAWDTAAGRLDFAALQQRLTAGNRLRTVVERRPAQFVAFDLLAAGGEDVRGLPLRERRALLEQTLLGLGSPIVLCQQTSDRALAAEWFDTLAAGGIEGVVIKDAGSTYPTTEGQRVWWKRKARTDLDLLAVGFTGPTAAPTALVLAFPGDLDDEGRPVTAGSTTVLNRTMQRSVTPLLHPTGDTFTRVFAWGQTDATTVNVIDPFVVEVSADAAAEHGSLRHAARLLRVRSDIDPADLPLEDRFGALLARTSPHVAHSPGLPAGGITANTTRQECGESRPAENWTADCRLSASQRDRISGARCSEPLTSRIDPRLGGGLGRSHLVTHPPRANGSSGERRDRR